MGVATRYKAGRAMVTLAAIISGNVFMIYRASAWPWSRPFAWLILSGIIAAGCVSQQSLPPTPAPPRAPEDAARASLRSGDFTAAANQFTLLADGTAEPQATQYRAYAAMLQADLGDHAQAQGSLAKITAPLPPQGILAQAGLKLSTKDYESSLFALNALDAATFDDYTKGVFLRSLGHAQLLAHDHAAALNLVNAELLGLPLSRRTELTHLIWRALSQDDAATLLKRADSRNPFVAGWRELITAYRGNLSSAATLGQALAAWRVQFPAHPANELLLDELLEQAEQASVPLQKVALVLPFEGPLAEYSGALRDGFIAMRLAANDLALSIATYNATGAATAAAYDQAVADGAQLIIGPLDKAGIETLAKRVNRTVPLLAMNTIELTPVTPHEWSHPFPALIQFGLTPEDEAEDLARRAWQDGHRRMASLIPNSDLGSRLANAFKQSWEHAGGVLVESARYANSEEGYKAAIREVFSLAQSEARAAALRRLLQRPLVFTAKPRADLDGVMLVAGPTEGRQIIPQFGQLGVDTLPLYATSAIFSGTVSAQADSDLGDITFGSMPWLLGTEDRELRDALNRHLPRQRTDFQRFYALGADAYRIAKTLSRFAIPGGNEISGATGRTLALDGNGRVKRTLTWARYRDGVPQLLTN